VRAAVEVRVAESAYIVKACFFLYPAASNRSTYLEPFVIMRSGPGTIPSSSAEEKIQLHQRDRGVCISCQDRFGKELPHTEAERPLPTHAFKRIVQGLDVQPFAPPATHDVIAAEARKRSSRYAKKAPSHSRMKSPASWPANGGYVRLESMPRRKLLHAAARISPSRSMQTGTKRFAGTYEGLHVGDSSRFSRIWGT